MTPDLSPILLVYALLQCVIATPNASELPRPGPHLVIEDIKVQVEKGVRERVLIFSTTPFTPLTFAMEGERPRFVIDIENTRSVKKGLHTIPVDGAFIRQIRTHHHNDSKTFRVVLDLHPLGNYTVNQAFYEAENILAIEIEADRKTAKREAPEEIRMQQQRHSGNGQANAVPVRPLLRREGKAIGEDDLHSMLSQHNFYATCWNSNSGFCNPDGNFENSYIDNGDATITDQATGLMWQKGGSASPLNMKEAKQYMTSLNSENFAGYCDWRLPTIEELASLLESSWKNKDLYVDSLFDHNQKTCWSSDTYGPDKGWKVNFHLGYILDSFLSEENSVRAVRSVTSSSPE